MARRALVLLGLVLVLFAFGRWLSSHATHADEPTADKPAIAAAKGANSKIAAKPLTDKLGEKIELDVTDTPLREIVPLLQDRHGVRIQLHFEALADDTPPQQYTLKLRDVPLSKVLDQLCALEQLAWAQDGETIVIAPPTRAREIRAAQEFAKANGIEPSRETDPAQLRTGRDVVNQVLREKTSLAIEYRALVDVMKDLAKQHRVRIVFDEQALKDAAISESKLHVTLKVKGISLQSALRHLLRPHSLTAVEYRGSLLITTQDRADAMLEPRVYPVADLVSHSRDLRGNLVAEYDQLLEMISTVIAPTTWDEVGGPGSRSAGVFDSIVVTQTAQVHEEIECLFAALRTARNVMETSGDPQPIWPRPRHAEITAALGKHCDIDGEELDLAGLKAAVTKLSSVPCMANPSEWLDSGKNPHDVQFRMQATGIGLGDALSEVLKPLGMAWMVRNEAVEIVSDDLHDYEMEVRVYPVGDLVGPHRPKPMPARSNDNADPFNDEGASSKALLPKTVLAQVGGGCGFGYGADFDVSPLEQKHQELSTLLTTAVMPTTWSDVGGPGSMTAYVPLQALVISQSRQAHEEITTLLAQLRAQRAKHNAEGAPRPLMEPVSNEIVLRHHIIWSDPVDNKGFKQHMEPAEVVELVKTLVEPDTWKSSDNFIQGATGRIIVRHHEAVHRKIEQVLVEIGAKSSPWSGGIGTPIPVVGEQPPPTVGGGFGGGGFGGGGF